MKKITLPGSKSITNRVLILAALGNTPVDLSGVLDSDDSRYMRAALEQFGVVFEALGENQVRVIPPENLELPPPNPLPTGEGTQTPELFIGNAGTAARFLSALSLITEGSFVLTGIKRMKQRPQADLQKALQDLGVTVSSLEREGFLPTRFTTEQIIDTSTVELSGQVSSQFLTALMLVAPRLEKGLTIKINGEVPSWPYIEMTLELLRLWGVSFSTMGREKIQIGPGITSPKQYQIPADMSSASYPIAWSLLQGIPIEMTNFGSTTLQGDEQFLDIAKKVGAQITRDGDKCLITPPGTLKSMGDMDWSTMPDVSMTGMILAAATPGTVKFTGLESLRVKECDRIVAMQQLEKLGVKIKVTGDDMIVTGNLQLLTNNPQLLTIRAYDDHRIAMCFGLLGATVDEPECVGKTWPEFWVELADWNGQLRAVSAIILHRVGTKCGKDKYLIVKKPRTKNAWQFPQGGVDPGESGLQAAKRELSEECGQNLTVKFKGEKPVGDYKYLFPKDFKRHDKAPHPGPLPAGEGDQRQRVLGAKVEFFYAEHLSGPVEVDGEEIIDHAWVTRDQLAMYFEPEYLEVTHNLIN